MEVAQFESVGMGGGGGGGAIGISISSLNSLLNSEDGLKTGESLPPPASGSSYSPKDRCGASVTSSSSASLNGFGIDGLYAGFFAS